MKRRLGKVATADPANRFGIELGPALEPVECLRTSADVLEHLDQQLGDRARSTTDDTLDYALQVRTAAEAVAYWAAVDHWGTHRSGLVPPA